MKKLKILFFFIISILTVHSQVSFPTSDAIWSVQKNSYDPEIYYGLTGDTIINDTTYNKLYLLNDTTLNIDENDIYIGGFRQKDQKVWFRVNVKDNFASLSSLNSHYCEYNNPFETLLYDFSKNSGDTIWHDLHLVENYITMQKQITLSIILEITNTNSQRTYYLFQYLNIGRGNAPYIPIMNGIDTWIEGIGSLKGLFWFLYEPPMSGGSAYRLNCFKQGNEIKYMDKNCTSCFKYSSTNISDNKYSSISVFLNKGMLSVKGEAAVFPCQIKLFNVIGQMQLSKTIYSDKESIYLPKELENVYLYQLINKKDESIVKTGKLINY
jgi:hypothetical protein